MTVTDCTTAKAVEIISIPEWSRRVGCSATAPFRAARTGQAGDPGEQNRHGRDRLSFPLVEDHRLPHGGVEVADLASDRGGRGGEFGDAALHLTGTAPTARFQRLTLSR